MTDEFYIYSSFNIVKLAHKQCLLSHITTHFQRYIYRPSSKLKPNPKSFMHFLSIAYYILLVLQLILQLLRLWCYKEKSISFSGGNK